MEVASAHRFVHSLLDWFYGLSRRNLIEFTVHLSHRYWKREDYLELRACCQAEIHQLLRERWHDGIMLCIKKMIESIMKVHSVNDLAYDCCIWFTIYRITQKRKQWMLLKQMFEFLRPCIISVRIFILKKWRNVSASDGITRKVWGKFLDYFGTVIKPTWQNTSRI